MKNILLKDWIEKPDCVEEAKKNKGLNILLETLVFLILMIVTMGIEAVVIGSIARFVLKTNEENMFIVNFTSVISTSLLILYAKIVQHLPISILHFFCFNISCKMMSKKCKKK